MAQPENDRRTDQPVEPGLQSWCPWTWDPGFWGLALIALGFVVIVAQVFDIDELWEIAGGAALVALGVSVLRGPFRRR